MNPLLEYKRIKQSAFKKNELNFQNGKAKKELSSFTTSPRNKEENQLKRTSYNESKAKQMIDKLGRASEKENTKEDHLIRRKNSLDEITLKESFLCEEEIKRKKELIQYNYCYICEQSKPCYCIEHDEYQDVIAWSKIKTNKVNIQAGINGISNIMKQIEDNKRKQFIIPCSKPTKKEPVIKNENKKKIVKPVLSFSEQFYLDQVKSIKEKLEHFRKGSSINVPLNEEKTDSIILNTENSMKNLENRLNLLKDMEKTHLQILSDLFEEYKDIEKATFICYKFSIVRPFYSIYSISMT